MAIQKICVYCGARVGNNPVYQEGAIELGRALAQRKIDLVYGGSRVGLMKIIADTVMGHGTQAIGVLPTHFSHQEPAHHEISQLHVVDGIHARKAMMETLADGFIAMPGGIGTFDELFEIICWGYIGLHRKPVGLLNINAYFVPMLAMIGHAVEEGFLPQGSLPFLHVAEDADTLLDMMGATHLEPLEPTDPLDPPEIIA
jgi:uncharacterized protein (TIGR00730 family)